MDITLAFCGHVLSHQSIHCIIPNNTQTFIVLYKLLAVYCIDHVPPNPQDGLTPLMLAAVGGHLPVARLLVETYHCDVNEEDGEVSGWVLMGGVSEHSTE